MIEAVRRAGRDAGAIRAGVDAWLRARRLMDGAGLARVAAIELLAAEPALRRASHWMVAVMALGGTWRRLLPGGEPPTAAGFLAEIAPAPVKIQYERTLGITENTDIKDAVYWMSAAYFAEIREQILADFCAKLDAAIAQYKRNCEAAGLVQQPVSAAERERLELLAEYLVEGKTVAALADARRQNSDARIRADLRAAAGACGLRIRARGRPIR